MKPKLLLVLIFITTTLLLTASALLSASVNITSPSEGYRVEWDMLNYISLTLECSVEDTTSQVQWSCESIPGVTVSWPDGNTGTSVTLTFTGLPTYNSGFGNTWVKATAGTISDTHNFKLFYNADGTNHPGSESGTTPNWYYYYLMTSVAIVPAVYYDPDDTGSWGGKCGFVSGSWKIFLTRNGHHYLDRSTWGNPCYIDRTAWTLRHEGSHWTTLVNMWGLSTNRNDMEDSDGDFLKNVYEATLGRGYNSSNATTYLDEVDYGVSPIPDAEDLAMRYTYSPYDVAITWTNGSADSVDWASPGNQ